MDWKDVVKGVAPTLGGLLTAFGGPAGALAGAGLGAIASALGVDGAQSPSVVEAQIAQVVARGLTPEQQAALIAADTEYKKALVAADVRKAELEVEDTQNFLMDIQSARTHNANTVGILRLGYMVNIASYTAVFMLLYGCYRILTGVDLSKVDSGSLVAISTLLGGVIQWVMSNAGQANGFFFGSSPTARATTTALASSVSDMASKLPNKGTK